MDFTLFVLPFHMHIYLSAFYYTYYAFYYLYIIYIYFITHIMHLCAHYAPPSAAKMKVAKHIYLQMSTI